MIDKGAYIGMHGASNNLHRLKILTNNLANINTTGFRADSEVMKPYKVSENGFQSRTYSTFDSTYTNFEKGPILNTGRDLDVAISGDGFIAIQSKTGKEGYTRAGGLELTKSGTLVTHNGEIVMGLSGPITIPPAQKVNISKDGSISAQLLGSKDIVKLNRIKLTNPPVTALKKGEDGLFYMTGGRAAEFDPNVKIVTGSLEGSNVNAISTLTQLIDLSRHYEIHTNVMKNMSDNASVANKLLEVQK